MAVKVKKKSLLCEYALRGCMSPITVGNDSHLVGNPVLASAPETRIRPESATLNLTGPFVI